MRGSAMARVYLQILATRCRSLCGKVQAQLPAARGSSEHHVSARHVCSFRYKQAALGCTPARRALRKGRATQQLIAPGCARKPPHARAARSRQPGCRDPCPGHVPPRTGPPGLGHQGLHELGHQDCATRTAPPGRRHQDGARYVGVQRRGGGRQARSHAGVAEERLPAGHHRHFERGPQLDAHVSEEGVRPGQARCLATRAHTQHTHSLSHTLWPRPCPGVVAQAQPLQLTPPRSEYHITLGGGLLQGGVHSDEHDCKGLCILTGRARPSD
jgi:hypothetical protein